MSGIFGALNLANTDRSYINTIGQSVVYEATQRLLAQYDAAMQAAMSVFVERETSDFALRYKLPGNGRLQRRGGQAESGAVKAYGSWDVGLPLEDFGAMLAGDDVAIAYMTMQEYNLHLDTIFIQDQNTVRFEILKAIFNNTARTFKDPINGDITVRPLAIGVTDGVLYPPVMGSETDAVLDRYAETGYASGSISDSNNPYATAVAVLEASLGGPTQGGGRFVTFINHAEEAVTRALAAFTPIQQNFVSVGTESVAINIPANIPGNVIGYVSGTWVSVWDYIPANYLVTRSLETPAPLLMRVDPADTGLGTGLQLVSEDTEYPFKKAHYRHRFGVGVGNRLNAYVQELGTGGTYTIPATFA